MQYTHAPTHTSIYTHTPTHQHTYTHIHTSIKIQTGLSLVWSVLFGHWSAFLGKHNLSI